MLMKRGKEGKGMHGYGGGSSLSFWFEKREGIKVQGDPEHVSSISTNKIFERVKVNTRPWSET